jgi:tetratricopeptide (TPR) repeat protein
MTFAAFYINPIRSVRVRFACASIVFVIAIILYARTLAPTVTLVDSGELIVAARTFGVAHPPGFPLYVLLAHLATLLPIGNIAARVNFASALFAALAAAALTLVVAEAMLTLDRLALRKVKSKQKDTRGKRSKKPASPIKDSAEPEPTGSFRWIIALAPCLVAGLLFAFSRTLWAYATIAEVYTLNTLLIVVIVLLMFRWRRAIIEDELQDGKTKPRNAFNKHDRWLNLAALTFGLAMGVHHVSVAVLLPAFAVLVYMTEGFGFFTSKRLLKAALFAFAGLSIYLYLPIAASRSPIMNWGDPRTFDHFWWHVTGRQYQVFLSPSLKTMLGQFGTFFTLVAREFNPVWLPVGLALALAGFVALFKQDRTVFLFLGLVIIGDLAYALNYEIAEDKDAYYLPIFMAMLIAAGFGAAWLIRSSRLIRLPEKITVAVLVTAIAVAPVVALASNISYNNRSRYYIAQDYVENILSTIEPGGMLLTSDWQVYSPMLYMREIEHHRKDVITIDINQLRRSWYFDYLNQTYPQMMEASRDKVEAFLADLKHWERDPEIYDRDITLNQRINTGFYDMILAFVTNHVGSAPVYTTLDVAVNFEGQNSDLTKSLTKSYDFVPQGLVFQLMSKGEPHAAVEAQLNTRGLADGSLRFADDDVVKLKVLPVYARMLTAGGRYLADQGRHEQAIEAYKQALALDPDFKRAQQFLNESTNALRKSEPRKQP